MTVRVETNNGALYGRIVGCDILPHVGFVLIVEFPSGHRARLTPREAPAA